MALTPASILADYSSGIGTQGATLKVNTSGKRVGIGTTNPQGTLQVGTGITMGSGIITATAAVFSGDLTVGGELTYEDVTNVDSVGVITARQGIRIGAGQSIGSDGALTYYGNGFNLTGIDTTAIKDSAGGTVKVQANTSGAVVSGILTATTLEQTQTYPTIRPTLDLNFAATKTLDRRITFTRDSVGTYYDELGVLKYASNNVPRFDHDSTTGESLGLLIEESRTNQVAYSNSGAGLDGAPYYGNWNAAPYTDNFAVAPDGTTTAWKMTPTTPSASRVRRISVTAGNTYTFSVWLKKDPSVSVSDGVWNYFKFLITWSENGSTVTSAAIEQLVSGSTTSAELTTEWKRFSVSYTAPANVTSMEFGLSNCNSGSGNPGYSAFVWGAQLEEGSFATSFIPTNGTTVTRKPDHAYIRDVRVFDFFNETEGTVLFEHTDVTQTTVARYPGIGFCRTNTVTSTRAIQVFFSTNNQDVYYLVRGSGSYPASDVVTMGAGSGFELAGKVAFVYKANDFVLARNGTIVGTDSSGALPDDCFGLTLGGNGFSDYQFLNAHIKLFKYYNKRLTNNQLQGLTA